MPCLGALVPPASHAPHAAGTASGTGATGVLAGAGHRFVGTGASATQEPFRPGRNSATYASKANNTSAMLYNGKVMLWPSCKAAMP